MSMPRLLLFALFLGVVLSLAVVPKISSPAQKAVETEPKTNTDRYSDTLPKGAIARLGTKRLRHYYGAELVAFVPDSKRLISTGGDGTLCIWDAHSAKELHRFYCTRNENGKERPGDIRALAVSVEGKMFAYGGWNGIAVVRDPVTGKIIREFSSKKGPVSGLAFAPDSKTLAVRDWNENLMVWEIASGKCLRSFENPGKDPYFVAFSGDGKQLASSKGSSAIQFFELSSGRAHHSFEVGKRGGWPIAYSPKVHKLAAVVDSLGGKAGQEVWGIRIWDANTGKVLHSLPVADGEVATALAFSPDGKTLAAGNGVVTLRDVKTGKVVKEIGAAGAAITCISFSADGKKIACAQDAVRIWNLDSGKEEPALEGHPGAVSSVAVSPDGLIIACASAGEIHFWGASSKAKKKVLKAHDAWIRTIAFGLGGSVLASDGADEKTVLWDAASGKKLHVLKGQKDKVNFRNGLAFSADGEHLVTAAADGYKVWNPMTGKLTRVLKGLNGLPNSLTVSPKGGLVAAGFGSFTVGGRIDVANWKTGEKVCTIGGIADNLAFSPDGRLLASGGAIWDLGTLSLTEVATRHDCWSKDPADEGLVGVWTAVQTVAFSPDGKLLAVGTGKGLRFFEPLTGALLQQIEDYENGISSLAFTPDGKTLVTGSYDATVLLWDVAQVVKPSTKKTGKLTAKKLNECWSLLGKEAKDAYPALHQMTADPDATTDFVQAQLHLQPKVDAKRFKELLVHLDSTKFQQRSQAQAELEKLGEFIVPALRKELTVPGSPEYHLRIKQLLAKLETTKWSPDKLRIVRAIQILEYIGTPKTRQFFQELSEVEPETLLVAEASAALHRLKK